MRKIRIEPGTPRVRIREMNLVGGVCAETRDEVLDELCKLFTKSREYIDVHLSRTKINGDWVLQDAHLTARSPIELEEVGKA